MWYTQWKDNSAVKSCPIEWEEFKAAFLGKNYSRESCEVKLEEFINLKQGKKINKEHTLKFTMFSRYAPSFVSNPGDEMSRINNKRFIDITLY